MKKISFLFLILSLFTFSSCIEQKETYLDEMIYNVKNDNDSTLHLSLSGAYKCNYRETIVYPGHTAFLYSAFSYNNPYFGFEEGLAEYDSCIVRLNDAEGEILKIWTKEENYPNEARDFFNQRWWQSKRIDIFSNSTKFTFTLKPEDFYTNSLK